MNDFYSNLEKVIANKNIPLAHTENGAVGYKRTSSKLLDMNFKLGSYRNASIADITNDVVRAYQEDKELTLKFIFFARDVLEGAGERRFFRIAIKALADRNYFPKHLVPFIPEYGRWDDLFVLEGTRVYNAAIAYIQNTLKNDMKNMLAKKPISLCAKWMPSINTSSKDQVNLAHKLANAFKISPRAYRKMLSSLRAYLRVVERDMSAQNWEEIDYEKVPSLANLRYKNAFMEHDYARRSQFLAALTTGEKKINASTAYPYDIVAKYDNSTGWYHKYKDAVDVTLEEMWKRLPTNFDMKESTIVVQDDSSSMDSRVGNSGVTALQIARSLAIYFAERLNGVYKNKYITFSERPQYINLSKANTLLAKLKIAETHSEVANTNIQRVFELILHTAVENNMRAEDMPKNILIISDMEFDSCTSCYGYSRPDETLFSKIARTYAANGYAMPKLIFWNVNSRTNVVPVQQNKASVVLLGGFSPNLMKMVMNGETDPYKALLATLNSERYARITIKKN